LFYVTLTTSSAYPSHYIALCFCYLKLWFRYANCF